MLTREDILGAEDLKTEVVSVPEWGGEVTIREMTGEQRDMYETHIALTPADQRKKVIRSRMAAMSIVDPVTKELLFTEADIEALSKKSAKALDRVFAKAAMLNRLTDEAVEEAAGN